MNSPDVSAFFDPATNSVSYLVADAKAGRCAIIDSVLDYDAASGRTGTASADRIIDVVRDSDYTVDWIIDTHVHADHLSAAAYLAGELGGRTAIGAGVQQVQEVFGRLLNLEPGFVPDGSQFDYLFSPDETYKVGSFDARAIPTPGHTPACMSHLIGDALFVGDTLFMPDYGTARCDFPGGDAGQLYDSIHALFSLPDETRMFLCHDYLAPGREDYVWQTTVGEQRRTNRHIAEGISREAFIAMRNERDSGLGMPALIWPAVQVNVRAGRLPPAEDNGSQYLKIPLNVM